MSLRVVSEPDLPDWEKNPKPNKALAQQYRVGTVVEDERGNHWRVEWDEQDHDHMWVKAN